MLPLEREGDRVWSVRPGVRDAVSDRWYNLLDNLSYDGYRSKVVVQFNLNYKGELRI